MTDAARSEEKLGFAEGEPCNRRGCQGVIAIYSVENCSCHIKPPCGACTAPRGYCTTCDWQEKDDRIFNDFVVNEDPKTGTWRTYTLRPLDPTKLDYHNKAHTHFSMIKEGVYPEGMTREQVLAEVKGTFGGRFEYFDKGRFKYVAYTD
jgi:hypothetical protein